MMNLKKFMQFEDSNVEMIILNNVVHFELISVAMALGYTKKAKGRLYPREERIAQILKRAEISTVVHNGQRYLSKDMLYDFMFEAHTEKCKEFKTWLKQEVLPQIEGTGGYIQDNREEEFINKYFPSFTDETKLLMIQDLLHQKEEYRKKNEEYEKQLEEQRPMIENYKILMDTTGTFSMNEVAHFAKIGEYKLFEFLRGIGILFKNSSGDNIPYENPVNKNKFIVCPAIAPDGKSHSVTRVLPSGIDYILKKLKEYEYVEAV